MTNPYEDIKRKISMVKRCPECQSLSLTSDGKRVYCKKCGFEQPLRS